MQFAPFIVDKQRTHKSLYAFFMDDEQIKYSLEYETIYFWLWSALRHQEQVASDQLIL